ncbi:MAG: hypothetical protein HY909_27310 [Deltaproteobacteria bacterium]|nr:hypothetical protein [Deltaproteobacteria bacterium]
MELRAFADLTAAMVVVADADHRHRGLRPSIVAALPEEVIMHSPFLQEIRAEGKAEGEAKGKAEALLAVLAARGLAATEAQAAAVLACRDLARLDAWLRVVASVTSVDQLLAAPAAA